MSKSKKSPAAPARSDVEPSAPVEGATHCPPEAATPSLADLEPWSDPWSVSTASGLSVDRICQACPGRTSRGEDGIWKVVPSVLEHLGAGEDFARASVEKAQPPKTGEGFEGAVVYALAGSGRVAVRSFAKTPRTSRTLAFVREPSKLRCGDEVIIQWTAGGRAEVRHGR